MKAHGEPPAEATTVDDDAPEEDERIGRGPAVAMSVVGAVVAWRLVVAFPEVALVSAGSLGTVGVQKVRARWAARGEGQPGGEKAAPPDVGEALRRLVGDDKGVLLTVLRDDLKLPDTKAVKALLEAEDIPWKPSRTRKGNGPAVRAEAIPPAPSPVAGHTHGDGCCCRSGDNNNDNSGGGEGLGEGLRVERRDTDSTYHLPTRQGGAGQGYQQDVLDRFVAELARRQPKPPEPPTT
ncbi:hypothetical protein ABZ392_33815 [Streptomyces sp. NPDC005885]|uniref:hypothetical protein n=1 Tax=Streptomyces sp. NPDC005885 TaxID=3157079 RepID=UPI0033FFB170